MRLIDADALIQVLCVNMDTGQQFDRATHCVDVMPTVDAIPIEWIEQYYGDEPAIYADRMIDAWREDHEIDLENGDPNGFNDETVQALKDTTERKNLSRVYETLDDMYADIAERGWMVKPMDEVRQERIKTHIANLKAIRDATLSGDDWEDWKPYIEAVTSGAFALGRMLDEDVVKVTRCENCPHSKEWVEQARQWTVWCEHFDMSTPRDGFCAIPVREKEGKDDE